MAGFKPACVLMHLPVRQRTQTGADRIFWSPTGKYSLAFQHGFMCFYDKM